MSSTFHTQSDEYNILVVVRLFEQTFNKNHVVHFEMISLKEVKHCTYPRPPTKRNWYFTPFLRGGFHDAILRKGGKE
jgi:hypothetical protein